MGWYYLYFKRWFELRETRERCFLLLLNIALLYAIFSFFIFRPLNNQALLYQSDISALQIHIDSWKAKITALTNVSKSPLYQHWLTQRKLIKDLEGKSKNILQTSLNVEWQDIIKSILQDGNNITLVQIKNFPETAYTLPTTNQQSIKLFQQKMLLVVYSRYFDTVDYLQRLEEVLPNIHWDSLKYNVVQYPIAKIEMEFSVFYEKPH